MTPRSEPVDLERLVVALREAGFSVVERGSRQPALLDIEDKVAGDRLELLVYLWLLRRRSGLPWRQGEWQANWNRFRDPPSLRRIKRRTLLLGYEPDSDVFVGWPASAGPASVRASSSAASARFGATLEEPSASASIPEETLKLAARSGIAVHRSRSAGLATAFRPEALRDYIEALPRMEDLAVELEAEPSRRKVDLVVPAEMDLPGALEVPALAAPPPPRGFGVPTRARARRRDTVVVSARRRDIATGFAWHDAPAGFIDRSRPLEPGQHYWFWFEIGAVTGSIEQRPRPVPDWVPDKARLVVRLFDFADGLELQPNCARGAIELRASGEAIVLERAGKVSSKDDALDKLQRQRLLFPVRTPRRSGDYKLRCNIYYGATLVQSRLVRARVGGGVRKGRAALRSVLDYSLAREITPEVLRRMPEHRLSMQVNGSETTHQVRLVGQDDAGSDFAVSVPIPGQALQDEVDMARGALRKVAWETTKPWRDGVDKYRYAKPLADGSFKRDLIALAVKGWRLYDAIVGGLGEDETETLERCVQASAELQVVTSEAGMYVPASLIYDHPLDDGEWDAVRFGFCAEFDRALRHDGPLEEASCFAGKCPAREDPFIVCPSGFWGYRHELGWPPSAQTDFELNFENRPQLTIGVSTDLDLYKEHAKRIQGLGEGDIVNSRKKLFTRMKTGGLHLVYLYCHGGTIGERVPYVEIGKAKSPSITKASLRTYRIRWTEPRPLVFINGCQTTALEPEQAINLVDGFVKTAKAVGVVGTEITVFEPLACKFAEHMLAKFMTGEMTVGAATRHARLELLRTRNPLGLAYVPFVAAGTRLVRRSSSASTYAASPSN